MTAGKQLPKVSRSRMLAVLVYATALGSIDRATTQYSDWMAAAAAQQVRAPKKYIQRNFQKFLQTGSVMDRPRSGRPKKVPYRVAVQAAKLLKEGYTIQYYHNNTDAEPQTVRKYYTSIKQACTACPELAQICKKYKITPARLLRRLHEVDKSLVQMKLHYKQELTQETMDARMEFAADQLRRMNHPQTGKKYLGGICYMDEASVVIASGKDPGVKVWASLHDQNVQQVLHIPTLAEGTYVKIHFVVVVNPILGPVFIEMTTGTTNIVRQENPRKEPYKVSWGMGSCCCRSHRRQMHTHPAAPTLLTWHPGSCCCTPNSSWSRYHCLPAPTPHPAVA